MYLRFITRELMKMYAISHMRPQSSLLCDGHQIILKVLKRRSPAQEVGEMLKTRFDTTCVVGREDEWVWVKLCMHVLLCACVHVCVP